MLIRFDTEPRGKTFEVDAVYPRIYGNPPAIRELKIQSGDSDSIFQWYHKGEGRGKRVILWVPAIHQTQVVGMSYNDEGELELAVTRPW